MFHLPHSPAAQTLVHNGHGRDRHHVIERVRRITELLIQTSLRGACARCRNSMGPSVVHASDGSNVKTAGTEELCTIASPSTGRTKYQNKRSVEILCRGVIILQLHTAQNPHGVSGKCTHGEVCSKTCIKAPSRPRAPLPLVAKLARPEPPPQGIRQL
ncbi:unnamed protein product [Periconia digitata]|uniref:Uncharacterized protein n=1 Tax=Periconia digitata TaxID=1303443 RepID=A0A9W4UGD6_9PLEO|nr:unnamed protein product [Periconia digitata]